MRITLYTDYAIRVLTYLGKVPDRLITVKEIATVFGVSQNHLVKIVQDLVKYGYVASAKGRGGGMKLAKSPDDINIGQIVRQFEPDLRLIDCNNCLIAPSCRFPDPLSQAMVAFFNVLDTYSLKDFLERDISFQKTL